MIIKKYPEITCYPFIDGCSRELRPGTVLPISAILDISVYPQCGSMDYIQICRIGKGPTSTIGQIVLGGPSGESIAVAEIPIDRLSDRTAGVIYDMTGESCGAIVCSRSMAPFLRVDYRIPAGNLILTPSVFRPRPIRPASGNLMTTKGSKITSVQFKEIALDEECGFLTDPTTGVTSIAFTPTPEESDTVVTSLRIINNSQEQLITDIKHLRMRTETGSALRLDVHSGEITIGTGR